MRNVISIASAKPDYATSFITMQLAEKLARSNPGKSILAIYRSYGPDPEEIVSVHVCPFTVPIYLDRYHPGLSSLYTKAALNTNNLTPDLVERLVKGLAEKYDLVICDAGGQIENAIALGCQFASEKSYYVFDHTEESIKRFSWIRPLLDKLNIKRGSHILDHTEERPEYTYGEFVNALGPEEKADPFVFDNENFFDEIELLVKAIGIDQFGPDKASSFEDRGDR